MLDYFERIIIKVACKHDRHKSLKKFRSFHAQEDCFITAELLGPEKRFSVNLFKMELMAEFVGSQVRDHCLQGYLSLHVVTY